MNDNPKRCDLCGGGLFETFCRRDRHGKPLDTVVCLGCGLVGHAIVPTEAELAEFYAHNYREDYHGEQRPSTRRVWRAHLKGERLLAQLRSHLPAGGKVFEVGAGIGCTVKVFAEAGYDASGIEPHEGFQQFSQTELRVRVRRGSLFAERPEAQFDLVLFVHVIEHMRSPRAALQAIHRLLKPGGLLYLECPSLGKQSGRIRELFHFAHIYTFTPITLLTLLKQCGFSVKQCFSDGFGRNHKFLLAKTEPVDCGIDPAGLTQTRQFIAQFQNRWHRLSPSYFAKRLNRIAIYTKEWLFGKRAVRKILQKT